jgi:hypothetical protein
VCKGATKTPPPSLPHLLNPIPAKLLIGLRAHTALKKPRNSDQNLESAILRAISPNPLGVGHLEQYSPSRFDFSYCILKTRSCIHLVTAPTGSPVPSWPSAFPPQVYRPPSSVRQAVCHRPAATWRIGMPCRSGTKRGLRTSSGLSWPHCTADIEKLAILKVQTGFAVSPATICSTLQSPANTDVSLDI